ncbi:MAG: hypothetical protein SAK29_12710 [Scytonema sp. PMC 1069.18]|nr:hypothetical protein [Scytonema sp. PMC 1069.18]MEC4887899.1 hypothetical protein [Scytonema sp. PMC 1070.18]
MYNRVSFCKFLLLTVVALGASSLTPPMVWAQNNSASNGVGNFLKYPAGTRIYENGRISTPGGSIHPSTTINNGNGFTTYYYPNGTQVKVRNSKIGPGGTNLRPGSFNGGLPTTISPAEKLRTPRGFNSER